MPKLVTAENIGQILQELGEMGVMATAVRWPDRPIPDNDKYHPYARGWATYSPWRSDKRIAALLQRLQELGAVTLVDPDRAWTLICAYAQTRTLAGEVWEAGVYQGGSARLLKMLIEETVGGAGGRPSRLRLFDTFAGMPQTACGLDQHTNGEFDNTTLETAQRTVGPEEWIDFRVGLIPRTFAGLEGATIRLAHVDVDHYEAVLDCCDFMYPRMAPGGVMVFDDYGFPSCPGARAAVDFFFRGRPEAPFPMVNGQCVVTRLGGG